MERLFPADVPPDKEDRASFRLMITGKVQRVGYRKWMFEQMHLHGLSGWVRNLTDGRVEAAVHGPLSRIAHIHRQCASGPARAAVDQVDIHPWTGSEVPADVRILKTADPPN